MDDKRSLDRRWFLASLALFLIWVATLATMAVFSGYKPADRAGAEGR